MRRSLSVLCLFLAPFSAAQTTSLRVLFLGNSLTAGNDVPAIVAALAQLQGVGFSYDARAPGGVSLEDHWNFGHAQLLRNTAYDLVVLQQGPSTLLESQLNLRQWTTTWADFARSQGTTPALFMVWPVTGQINGFSLVATSYRNAAAAAGTEIFPAGEGWQDALAASPGLQLYSDDLHATPAGSLLAAMVIARGMFALDPARVPARLNTVGGVISVSSGTLAVFRSVIDAMPARTLTAARTPGTPTPPGNTPAPTPAPPATPSPSTGAASGGGGSPSLWFLGIVILLALLCRSDAARSSRV